MRPSILASAGVVTYYGTGRLILIAGLAVVFGIQNATARQIGVQELASSSPCAVAPSRERR